MLQHLEKSVKTTCYKKLRGMDELRAIVRKHGRLHISESKQTQK